jgi:RNA polymerase sigma-70 factor (family 1)
MTGEWQRFNSKAREKWSTLGQRPFVVTFSSMFIEPLVDEDEILMRLQTGDEHSFNLVYQHYFSFVCACVIRLIHSPQLAEDVTQDIFIKVWEKRSGLAEIKSFRPWLFIMARNHSINVLKKAARCEEGMGEIIRHFHRSPEAANDEILNNEYAKFIQNKLNELPPRAREVFQLCREQSKTYSEVATALGITRDAVKSRMVHAMKHLRNSAEKEMGLPRVVNSKN